MLFRSESALKIADLHLKSVLELGERVTGTRDMRDRATVLRYISDMPTPFGGNFQRIVQTPGGISIFYDTGQGQGFQRNIVMNGTPHLPSSIRLLSGDARGHWEGNTLVIDTTNFTPKLDSFGSRENKHLIERFTRTSPTTLEYKVTIEDPTVFTKPWTIQMDFTKQSDETNRIYYEPR